MSKPLLYLYDAAPLIDRVRDAFEDEIGIAWELDVALVVENVFTNLIHGDRYRGEQRLEEYLLRKGFSKSYETVELTRSLHQFAYDEFLAKLFMLHSSLRYRLDFNNHALLITAYDGPTTAKASIARPFPHYEDEQDENYVPERIRRYLRELRNAN